MMVPIDAIVEGDQPYVLIVDDSDHVVKSPVVLGIQGPNFYQVISGVKVGDRVIVGNQSDFQPGQVVSPSPVDIDLTAFDKHRRQIRRPLPPPSCSSRSEINVFVCDSVSLFHLDGVSCDRGDRNGQLLSMPVDLFPAIKIPVVVVATFYSGMPPQQIEADITDTFERFFTLGSGIDHIESRSMTGVSLIKVYFHAGTDPNADVSNISNLAMADLRRLPPGTLPPVVFSFDASNLPVCLITVEGKGLNQTQLKDYAQFEIRNQVASVRVPRYRSLMAEPIAR